MRILLILAALWLISPSARQVQAQVISNVDFDYIKSQTTDENLSTWYPNLLQRLQDFDTTLTPSDYVLLYYGNAFFDKYNPYGIADGEEEFNKLYGEEKFKQAIPFGEKALAENPINLKTWFRMLICHHMLGEKDKAGQYAYFYYRLLAVIYASGDGRSMETSWVVLKVSDEYAILADMELDVQMQALVNTTDVMTISKKQKKVKGQKRIKKLYFNVQIPLMHMAKMFDKKE